MNPRLILSLIVIIMAALSYWIPQTLGASVVILGAANLVPASA